MLLGAIYLVDVVRRCIAMTRWGLGRLLHQLEAVVSLLARALPMIALLVTFLFLTAEVWQTAGDARRRCPTGCVVCLFPLVGVLFLASADPDATSASSTTSTSPTRSQPLRRRHADAGDARRRR